MVLLVTWISTLEVWGIWLKADKDKDKDEADEKNGLSERVSPVGSDHRRDLKAIKSDENSGRSESVDSREHRP